MAVELELRWLKTNSTQGAVKRFAEFCKEDVQEQSKLKDFDLDKYKKGVEQIMKKLDRSKTVGEIFNAD